MAVPRQRCGWQESRAHCTQRGRGRDPPGRAPRDSCAGGTPSAPPLPAILPRRSEAAGHSCQHTSRAPSRPRRLHICTSPASAHLRPPIAEGVGPAAPAGLSPGDDAAGARTPLHWRMFAILLLPSWSKSSVGR
eukprot:scaffold699_cov385-Prasinococcus_capsulatus_cf.AAC.37